MNVYPELAKIAELNEEIKRLCESVAEKIDCDGYDLKCAYLVENCIEKNGHLYNEGGKLDFQGVVDNDYYCRQYTGYCEDYYYGTLYFATNKKGVFVAVPFDM